MPKDADFEAATPMKVEAATRVFGSPLRAHLVRYYASHPGHSQMQAAHALGMASRSVTNNVRVLVVAGALIESAGADRRTLVYHVDQAVVDQLLTALRDFTHPADVPPTDDATS